MLEQLQGVIDYLNENMPDPVPQFIIKEEIMHSSSYEDEYNNFENSYKS